MVWNIETSQGYESAKIASIAVPYLRGRGLDIGCGTSKVWPHAIGLDNGHHFGKGAADMMIKDATDLGIFADSSLDFIFSSHLLEHIVDYKNVLQAWWAKLKVGGYLVLYLPHKDFYPNIGEDGANPDHKNDFVPDDIIAAMKDIGSWEMLENETRSGSNEYSMFLCWRKTDDGQQTFNIWQRNPEGKQRALVIRLGAIGDQIMTSSVLPELKKQGYHLTFNTTPDAKQILLHDPHIDEWLLQDKDQVPNPQLGPYWESLKERYDHVVNLCESVEGALLQLPGRLGHSYTHETRQRLFGTVNYLERTHDIAAVPHNFAPKFYATDREIAEARHLRHELAGDAPFLVWAINGSSPHKVYPYTQIVLAWLMEKTPAHVALLADGGIGRELQKGIMRTLEENGADTRRIHGLAGGLEIRQSIALAQQADCVVGPETGILNAVCMEDMPKVIYLSHSSAENLTKHWVNTRVLEADIKKCPCKGCHRLHYGWEHCHQVEETGAALCATSISPEELFSAIATSLIRQVEEAA